MGDSEQLGRSDHFGHPEQLRHPEHTEPLGHPDAPFGSGLSLTLQSHQQKVVPL